MLLEGNVSVKAAILGNHRKVEKLYYDKSYIVQWKKKFHACH